MLKCFIWSDTPIFAKPNISKTTLAYFYDLRHILILYNRYVLRNAIQEIDDEI